MAYAKRKHFTPENFHATTHSNDVGKMSNRNELLKNANKTAQHMKLEFDTAKSKKFIKTNRIINIWLR